MSVINVAVYKSEDELHTNPGTLTMFETGCENGFEGFVNKSFREVLIHWDAGTSEWIIDEAYIPGASIVALETTNPCDGTTALLNYKFHDFRLAQLCCRIEEEGQGLFLWTEDGLIIDTEGGSGIGVF